MISTFLRRNRRFTRGGSSVQSPSNDITAVLTRTSRSVKRTKSLTRWAQQTCRRCVLAQL